MGRGGTPVYSKEVIIAMKNHKTKSYTPSEKDMFDGSIIDSDGMFDEKTGRNEYTSKVMNEINNSYIDSENND